MVPVLAAPPKTPSTYHLTPVLVVPVTVAVNCFVVFVGTLALVGEMEIATCACTEAVAVKAMKQSAISERRRPTVTETAALASVTVARTKKARKEKKRSRMAANLSILLGS